MELAISSRAGLIDDPRAYLLEHDEGSHRLSLILLRAFDRIPTTPHESFGAYFQRIVAATPLGRLQEEFDSTLA
jgi:hypothetical protein